MAAPYEIRIFGDPVLKQRATEISDIDGTLVRLAEDMVQTMYDAPGLGLAAPQVGVQQAALRLRPPGRPRAPAPSSTR